MNKGLIPVVMLALVAAPAIGAGVAHGNGHRGHGGARASLAETLALTEDQQAEFSGLRESFAEASQALRASHREAFEGVLTTAQLATLEAIRESGTRPRVRGWAMIVMKKVMTLSQRKPLPSAHRRRLQSKSRVGAS